jgi:hypothetical protein
MTFIYRRPGAVTHHRMPLRASNRVDSEIEGLSNCYLATKGSTRLRFAAEVKPSGGDQNKFHHYAFATIEAQVAEDGHRGRSYRGAAGR